MKFLLTAVVALVVACGGTEEAKPPQLAGCWHFTLDGVQAGGMQLQAAGDHYDGTFAYSIWTGSVFGRLEAGGDFAVLMYTGAAPGRLMLEASGPGVRESLNGTAVEHITFTQHAFAATRCGP